MATPDLELQGGIYALLTSDAILKNEVSEGVYDAVPGEAVVPYVTLGEAQLIRSDATGLKSWGIYLTLHAWSREIGFVEVKTVAGCVVDALHHADIPLTTYRLISINHQRTRTFRDPDEQTSHAVIEFVAFVEKL
ncbi:DUF3168 domain-containing protein [Agrobacterium rosae]|uniref:DUF3168 domain-containing protein n=1 Tax=Agrobacterium rosae TaxID=1972867 RepID=A0ABU4VYL4_9HYPH|nr:DUF3168 domain-containing protein [Agrobacterium rosae]MDX8329595.1 DUF3168 domain-containing protein [Agrobacterium rosae]